MQCRSFCCVAVWMVYITSRVNVCRDLLMPPVPRTSVDVRHSLVKTEATAQLLWAQLLVSASLSVLTTNHNHFTWQEIGKAGEILIQPCRRLMSGGREKEKAEDNNW